MATHNHVHVEVGRDCDHPLCQAVYQADFWLSTLGAQRLSKETTEQELALSTLEIRPKLRKLVLDTHKDKETKSW
jgi:hypothetical protein